MYCFIIKFYIFFLCFFFFSSRRRHTRWPRDWSSDVCSSDLSAPAAPAPSEPQSEAAWPIPDLVILDGGKGQLSAGQAALSDAGLLQIPMAALAKEREELFVPSRAEPIVLPRTSQGLYLVPRIRDEAHRFAVTYHQKVRGKRATRS